MSLGIQRDSRDLAEIHVGRQLQRVLNGIERDCLNRLLRDRLGSDQQWQDKQPAPHHILPNALLVPARLFQGSFCRPYRRERSRDITLCRPAHGMPGLATNLLGCGHGLLDRGKIPIVLVPREKWPFALSVLMALVVAVFPCRLALAIYPERTVRIVV